MSNFFKNVLNGIEKPFQWLDDGLKYLPKILQAGKDAEADVPPVIAGITTICGDVDAIVGTGAADFAEFVVTAKPLWAAVVAAASAGGTNITLDLALIPDIQAAVAQSKDFTNEWAKLEKLATDWKATSALIEADFQKLKGDFEPAPTSAPPAAAPALAPELIAAT